MTKTLPPLLLVGCGKMGGAMLAGWRERGLSQAIVVDPFLPAAPDGATLVKTADAIPPGFAPAAVVLAIKPQEAAAGGAGDDAGVDEPGCSSSMRRGER